MARPRKNPSEKYETPKRPGWRVNDETWNLLRSAANARGETLVGWAMPILIRAAKRVVSQGKTRFRENS